MKDSSYPVKAVPFSSIADSMVERLKELMEEDLDVVFYYGSRLKGTTRQHSDFDLSFIPREGATRYTNLTVAVGGVLFDLYPISWEGMNRLANCDNPSTSLLLKTNLVYCRNDAVRARFEGLRTTLDELLSPAGHDEMARKSLDLFRKLGTDYYLLQAQVAPKDLYSAKHRALRILGGISHCLAVLNQSVTDTRKLENLLALQKQPADLAELTATLVDSEDVGDIQKACTRLMQQSRALILEELNECIGGPVQLRDFSNYPEARNALFAILDASERGNRYLALLTWTSIRNETAQVMMKLQTGCDIPEELLFSEYAAPYLEMGFPDLLPAVLHGDLDELKEGIAKYDTSLRTHFLAHAVDLCDFEDAAALQVWLDAFPPLAPTK